MSPRRPLHFMPGCVSLTQLPSSHVFVGMWLIAWGRACTVHVGRFQANIAQTQPFMLAVIANSLSNIFAHAWCDAGARKSAYACSCHRHHPFGEHAVAASAVELILARFEMFRSSVGFTRRPLADPSIC